MDRKLLVIFLSLTLYLPYPVHADEQALVDCQQTIANQGHKEALQFCEQALRQLNGSQLPIVEAKLKLALYDIYSAQGKVKEANQALAQIKQSTSYQVSEEIQYLWLRKKATRYLEQQQYKQAQDLFKQAFNIAKRKNNSSWLAKSYNDMAIIERKFNRHELALQQQKKSLQLKEQLGNDFHIGNSLKNIAIIYQDLEKYQQAQKYYELALASYQKYQQANNSQQIVPYLLHLYQSLAVIYSINGEHQKKNHFRQQIFQSLENDFSIAERVYQLYSLARVHINANEFSAAKPFIDNLLQYLNSSEHVYQSQIYFLNSKMLEHNKEPIKAIEQVKLAIEKSTAEDSKHKMRLYQFASGLYFNNGRPYEAFTMLKLYQQQREALLQDKFSNDIQVIQSAIESERMERELVEEQVIRQQKEQQVDRLFNSILLIIVVVILLASLVLFYLFKKRKEQQQLLTVVESHKQQLLLLTSEELVKNPSDDFKSDQSLAELLVNAMVDGLAIWEKSTKTNKVELADQSQIWKVSIDDGRLRTRSLDKYLSIKKIPANPRWRTVVKTCHFILAECQLEKSDRDLLTQRLNSIMLWVKQQSTTATD